MRIANRASSQQQIEELLLALFETKKHSDQLLAERDAARIQRDSYRTENARMAAALSEIRGLIEETDAKIKQGAFEDDEGFVSLYQMRAGRWHKFLAWARSGEAEGVARAARGAVAGVRQEENRD